MPFVNVEGYDIFYEKKGKKTALPPLILLHGIQSSTIAWVAQLEFFKDYTEVYAYDQLGHARSAQPEIEYDLRFLSKILYGFIKKLKIKNPVILGHSMGGFILQVFTLLYPNVPKKIVLACTAPKAMFDLPLNLLARVGTPIIKFMELFYPMMLRIGNSAKGSPEKPRNIITKELASAASCSAKAMASIMKHISLLNISKIVNKIKVPTLFVSAEKDFFKKFAQFYKENLNAEVFIIKGGEHTPFEVFKDQFNPALLNFIKK